MSSDIVTYPLNGITYTAEEAAGYHSARTSGVYCLDEDFKVSLSSGGKSVWISPGRAWVHPSRFTGYSIIMQAPVTLALSTRTPLCSRIDRVVLRFDRNARRSYLTVLMSMEIFGDTISSSAAPQITRNGYIYDLCLAEIRHFAGANTISRLIDTRGDESLCGLMRDGVTRIPELTIGTVTTGETASATIKNGVLSLVLPNGNGGSSTGGSGLSETSKTLLLSLLENAAYTSPSMQAQLNALRTEWSSSGGGGGGSGGSDEIPVQSISLSSSALTLNEGESKTLTATVLPADATYGDLVLNFSPGSFVSNSGVPVKLSQNVRRYTLKALKAGTCTVTATAGGKSASCTVTVEAAETAQLIYTLPAETELTSGFDTGLKLLEHASTESPQYTILVDAKAGDNFDASTWPAFLHCLTETGSTANLPGFNSTSSPLNNKTEFAYYNYGGVTLSDSIEHLKTRTRYVVQLDGKKYRGGSTYCPMTEWMTSNGTITDVPQTFLIGAAQSADGSKKQQFWPGTLYQCEVYKGLLSDEKVNEYIEKGW